MPQLQARTSVSSLCLSSRDSPLMSSSFKNMSTAMAHLLLVSVSNRLSSTAKLPVPRKRAQRRSCCFTRDAFARRVCVELKPVPLECGNQPKDIARGLVADFPLRVGNGALSRTRCGSRALDGRKLGHQPQRHGQPFQLIVRPQEEAGCVVTRVAFYFLYGHLGGSQRF